jgi:transposase
MCQKKVKQYISQEGLRLLDWPGNISDMNPIENIWKLLKDKMNQENVTTNKRQLTERMVEVWFHDQQLKDCAKTMIQQIPNRFAAVIKVRGAWTKY